MEFDAAGNPRDWEFIGTEGTTHLSTQEVIARCEAELPKAERALAQIRCECDELGGVMVAERLFQAQERVDRVTSLLATAKAKLADG